MGILVLFERLSIHTVLVRSSIRVSLYIIDYLKTISIVISLQHNDSTFYYLIRCRTAFRGNEHSKFSNTAEMKSVNETIGKYIIEDKLGMGSYSVVKKAMNRDTNRMVAIKIVDKHQLSRVERLALRQEIRILKMVRLFYRYKLLMRNSFNIRILCPCTTM